MLFAAVVEGFLWWTTLIRRRAAKVGSSCFVVVTTDRMMRRAIEIISKLAKHPTCIVKAHVKVRWSQERVRGLRYCICLLLRYYGHPMNHGWTTKKKKRRRVLYFSKVDSTDHRTRLSVHPLPNRYVCRQEGGGARREKSKERTRKMLVVLVLFSSLVLVASTSSSPSLLHAFIKSHTPTNQPTNQPK